MMGKLAANGRRFEMRPVAFRVFDFKSIEDSGICRLSGDGITVLAGQNEAGKTAVLTALRDFDLEVGTMPSTQDYEPEERPNSNPRVAIEFGELDLEHIVSELDSEKRYIPTTVIEYLKQRPTFWITRTLKAGQFSFEETLIAGWEPTLTSPPDGNAAPDNNSTVAVSDTVPANEPKDEKTLMPADEFAGWLRSYWPTFVYFEAFQDSLPRQVNFNDTKTSLEKSKSNGSTTASPSAGSPPPKTTTRVSSSVLDFVLMADLDIARIDALASNDKMLGNYLSHCGASITGDFLTYWKQKVDKEETVDLRVRHLRDETGVLKLAFYVHDKSDQYPDQRSKGFLWFLSFYLKLAAAQKRYPDRRRILLIDEPGSYLHARAQRDVLHLLEARIVQSDQVIYSTHSPYLIHSDRLHRLRIVLKKTASGTKVLDRLTHPDLRDTEFADSLSPVISAIGIDISQSITFNRQKNLFVEGISDYMYVTSWARKYRPELVEYFNIFPGTGATTLALLASLFIGWGFKFIALLDNDDQGQNSYKKLTHELSVPEIRIVRPKDAKTIEDVFSQEDFRALLSKVDKSLTLNTGERPSAAIGRQNVDKVLLARAYSEQVEKIELTKKSEDAIKKLLNDLLEAWEK
jgi:hypothetical protein